MSLISSPRHAPLHALLSDEAAVLAVIARTEGPSYRPEGAMMAVLPNGDLVGSLSSGCIESDIACQAADARQTGKPKLLRYGKGSPFIDLVLPCGGSLQVLLLPKPDKPVLRAVADNLLARKACAIKINVQTGAMDVAAPDEQPSSSDMLVVKLQPDLRFLIFGKGPEASAFASLTGAMSYPHLLLSPDKHTLDVAADQGCQTQLLSNPALPPDLAVDEFSAVVLFFHDHDWEPEILSAALDTPAFYIGAQGSRRARDSRLNALAQMGIPPAQLSRLRGPIGLIPSARDASTLAVSVLAEILSTAQDQTR